MRFSPILFRGKKLTPIAVWNSGVSMIPPSTPASHPYVSIEQAVPIHTVIYNLFPSRTILATPQGSQRHKVCGELDTLLDMKQDGHVRIIAQKHVGLTPPTCASWPRKSISTPASEMWDFKQNSGATSQIVVAVPNSGEHCHLFTRMCSLEAHDSQEAHAVADGNGKWDVSQDGRGLRARPLPRTISPDARPRKTRQHLSIGDGKVS
jgi:hypothetical protein